MLGNKAKNLQLLMAAGFNVKPMVIILAEKIEEILEQSKLPSEIREEIESVLDFSCGVAVRSSATEEDGDLSWAGQFKTRLWINPAELEAAILDCARACNSEQVKAYLELHKTASPKLALIVQEMVDAEVSGVVFTTNPVCNSGEIVIEGAAGVSEDLVNGICQPERYHVDYESLAVKKYDCANSASGIISNHIGQICEASKKICGLFGCHQDIEWAIEKNTGLLFINQARRITVTSSVNKSEIDRIRNEIIDEKEKSLGFESRRMAELGVRKFKDVLSDQNIAELITSHPCQMAFGLFLYLFAQGDGAIRNGRNEMGYDIGPELETGFFSLIGGQPRCSIVHDAFTYRIRGIPLEDYCRIIDHYLEEIGKDQRLANYPEVSLYQQQPSEDFLCGMFGSEKGRRYREYYLDFFEQFKRFEMHLYDECVDGFLPAWRKLMEDCQQGYRKDCSIESAISHYRNIADLLRTEACKMFVKVARIGFFAYARLNDLLAKLFGEDGKRYAEVLTSGIPLEMNPNLEFSYELFRLKNGQTTLAEILDRFGHLGIHELEISFPRYRDQPDALISLANQIVSDPREEMMQSLMRSEKLQAHLAAQAGGHSDLLEREIRMARRYLPLREMVKFEYLKGYEMLREIAINLNRRLKWEDGLIFHLRPEEIFDVTENHNSYASIAARRRERREKEKAVYVPQIISVGKLDLIGDDSNGSGNIIRGIGVTNCTAEGVAVVILDTQDADSIRQLEAGSILVTATTDPAWSPVLSIVGSSGGLVTEVGGLLAHGAIYAREVGMAAVLNVPRATKRIQTGMRIRVNGCQNYVEILG